MKLLTHSQTPKVLTTFNHAGGSLNLCKGQHQEYPNNPVFSIFFVVSCMLSTYHVSSRIVISIYSILIPMNKHKWKICFLWSKPGMGLLSQLPSFRYFQFFSIVMTHLSYCIRSHLKGVAVAQLQWHLPNMNVIKKIRYLLCHILSGAPTW